MSDKSVLMDYVRNILWEVNYPVVYPSWTEGCCQMAQLPSYHHRHQPSQKHQSPDALEAPISFKRDLVPFSNWKKFDNAARILRQPLRKGMRLRTLRSERNMITNLCLTRREAARTRPARSNAVNRKKLETLGSSSVRAVVARDF